MLILTRRNKETIRINDDISITVLGIKGNQVRLGINAPKEVTVHREEIYQKILAEQEESHVNIVDLNIPAAVNSDLIQQEITVDTSIASHAELRETEA